MSRILFLVVCVWLVSSLLPAFVASGLAKVPDPPMSIWDGCLGRSPKNDVADPAAQYVYHGILRDGSGTPVPGYPASQVELEIFCVNPVILHPDGPSNANGEVVWGAGTLTQGGGACSAPQVVELRVAGMPFFHLDDVRSPDTDGDSLVALADLIDWQMSFVNQNPIYIGDLDCDGFVSLSDLSLWQKHFVAR